MISMNYSLILLRNLRTGCKDNYENETNNTKQEKIFRRTRLEIYVFSCMFVKLLFINICK